MASPPRPSELESVLARVRLLALDVDGTLTDGCVAYHADDEVAVFHVHDGLGLAWLREAGVEVAWISGRRGSRGVERRARDLGVRELHLGVKDKLAVLAEVQRRLDVGSEDTAAMGDDVVDLDLCARAALFVAPANARAEVKACAGLVTAAAGGAGAVRELCERVLAARGLWQARIERASGRGAMNREMPGAAE